MILNFKKVILHNFASYAHAEIELSNKGFCLVSGRNNFQKDNSLSNGSGKSFIWSAICYTLTGETINGQHAGLKNNIIEEDSCFTTVVFSADNDEYEITRFIAPKSDLHIIKNKIDVSGKGIMESRKKLGELLPDLSKDLIASTFIIGQGMPNAFSKFSPSGRKEVLEKLTKSDFMIEEVKTRITNRLNTLATQLRGHEDYLLVHNTKLNDAKDRITRLSTQLTGMVKPDFEAEKANVQLALTELETQNIAVTNTINQLNQTQTELNNKAMSIADEKMVKIRLVNTNYINATNDGFAKKVTLSAELGTLNAEIANIKAEITKIQSVKEFCPTCGQRLQGINKPSTTLLEETLASKEHDAKLKRADLEQCNTGLDKAFKQKEFYLNDIETKFNERLGPVTEEKAETARNITLLGANQRILVNNIATSKAKLAQLDTESLSWDTNYQKLLKELAETEALCTKLAKNIADETIKKLDTEEHIATVKKIDTLAKRDLRGHLLSNIIAYIDKKAKDFSDVVFGTRELSIRLAGNALDITYCNKVFDNLSGGEKMRVDLILQLAIRDMLKTYLSTHANILVLDEITDFLDKQSCAAVMKLLESELNAVESVFIISHHTDELGLAIDTELKIVKDTDGISSVL